MRFIEILLSSSSSQEATEETEFFNHLCYLRFSLRLIRLSQLADPSFGGLWRNLL